MPIGIAIDGQAAGDDVPVVEGVKNIELEGPASFTSKEIAFGTVANQQVGVDLRLALELDTILFANDVGVRPTEAAPKSQTSPATLVEVVGGEDIEAIRAQSPAFLKNLALFIDIINKFENLPGNTGVIEGAIAWQFDFQR